MNRRSAIAAMLSGLAAACVTGCASSMQKAGDALAAQPSAPLEMIPKIDIDKCVACGRCAKVCKKKGSAVKCQNDFEACGYCVYCYGYFGEDPATNPDSRICPTGALVRRKLGEYRYEYTINLSKCIGCGKCIESCGEHGNKSLSLAVKPELCLGCDECSCIKVCPASAISRAKA